MSVLNRDLVQRVAAALDIAESLVEKDWHAVRALGVIAGVVEEGVRPVFSGGTSLAKGWGAIKRFSEDIDFKIGVTAPTEAVARTRRSSYRKKVLEALAAAGFTLAGEPEVRNKSLFVRASLDYGATFPSAGGLRAGLKIEMTFKAALREPTARPLQSLLAEAERIAPEVPAFLCVDPLETAADKLCALAWRTEVRDRSSAEDDPTIVRHLHDLTALAERVRDDPAFATLAREILEADVKRAKDAALDGAAMLRRMLPAIAGDPLWRDEYDRFVSDLSYARGAEAIDFERAIAACEGLVKRVLDAEAEFNERS